MSGGGARPPRLLPMAATRVSAPPAGRDAQEAARWAWEVKWDGMRAIITAADGRTMIRTRNDRDVTGGYPELASLIEAIAPHSVVLDGEIVVFDEHGVSSFELLQRRMHVSSAAVAERLAAALPVTLVLFDGLSRESGSGEVAVAGYGVEQTTQHASGWSVVDRAH